MECKSIYGGLQLVNPGCAGRQRAQIRAIPAAAGIFCRLKSKGSLASLGMTPLLSSRASARDLSSPDLLVLRHRVEGLGDHLPAAVGLEQGQVVGEIAWWDLAFDLGEGGARAGEVDRHDAV